VSTAADTAPTAAAPAAGPCVYYDGACPLCSREIATYQRAQGGDQLQWVDAAVCPAPALGAALPREDALARLHVRLPDGRLLSGAAAFVAIWRRLPAFRGLALLARVPGAVWAMEMLYRGFLAVRPLWRPQPLPAAWLALPLALRRELRTDHAGEAGAVMIYRGVLALARDAEVRAFAQHHLHTEQQHLALIEAVVPRAQRSRLLPLWLAAGWLTGALPALFGPRAVYATIEAVETFVDTHYADQVAMIDALPAEADPSGSLPALRQLLETCRLDEVAHRDDAHTRRGTAPAGVVARLWTAVVGRGSAAAVRVSRHV
jgi:demethoxyubiquinone hydroxylase (CLK1/Coq7/Cat5 family)/predicted DCC family thiol-disulfide oxidoreductase YuxK